MQNTKEINRPYRELALVQSKATRFVCITNEDTPPLTSVAKIKMVMHFYLSNVREMLEIQTPSNHLRALNDIQTVVPIPALIQIIVYDGLKYATGSNPTSYKAV